MSIYMLCKHKETKRLALLNEDEFDKKDWEDTDEKYIADTWLDAREQVSTRNRIHVEYHGWFEEKDLDHV